MKWSNRIAQGFSPGTRRFGLRPERATELGRFCNVFRRGAGKYFGQSFIAFSVISPIRCRGLAQRNPSVGRPFRAFVVGTHPGLKPWAVLSDHFMVMTAERKAQNWRSRTIGRRGERTANGKHLTDNNYTSLSRTTIRTRTTGRQDE